MWGGSGETAGQDAVSDSRMARGLPGGLSAESLSAQVVQRFSWAALCMMVVYLGAAYAVPSLALPRDWLIWLCVPLAGTPLLLLHLGWKRVAATWTWLVSWSIVSLLCLTSGGLQAPGVPLYMTLMLTSALLSQGRALWLAFAASLVSVLLLASLGFLGLLPTPMRPTHDLGRLVALVMGLIWLALMLRTSLAQLRAARRGAEAELERRRQSEAELRAAHAELQALNERLEARVAERTAELVTAKEAALSASKAKSEFLATMSHELRTPVAGVVGLVELLGRCELPRDARDMLGPLLSSGKTLLSLIGDVLDYSKIEAGRLEIERIPMRVRAVLRDVISLLRPKAEAQGLKLDLTIDDAVPSYVLCDPTRLQQIVLNLVGNALKFTPSGSVQLRVSYRADRLTLAVRDTGIGISKEAQAQLFHSFVQADQSTTRKYGGSGLGLMITRQLANLMGGDVSVESELGVGSTFTCTVQAPQATRPRAEAESLPDLRRPLRILLAEDNDINAFILGKLLGHLGHSCERVNDGRQAVDRASEGRYDAILMDMHMPVLDGLDATRQIRALSGPRRDVPIIGLSADAIVEHEATYKASGLSAYLVKPCTLAQLQQTLVSVTASAAGAASA